MSDDPSPIKDPDNEHPVAGSWRPIFHRIAAAFLQGNYSLAHVDDDVRVHSKSAAEWIEQSITEYPETLVELSDPTWISSVASWQEGFWEVLVDLWTAESGRSDLVLHARVYEKPDGVRIVVESVHVP